MAGGQACFPHPLKKVLSWVHECSFLKRDDSSFDIWVSLFADDCAIFFNSHAYLELGASYLFNHLRCFGLMMHIADGQFDPAVFWADTTIMLRFPLHNVVARSYLSAMLHEATCEHTFSYTGRVLTKERQTIDAEQVCASAVCVAGEAVYEMSPNEI
jgi:hypothetical protein